MPKKIFDIIPPQEKESFRKNAGFGLKEEHKIKETISEEGEAPNENFSYVSPEKIEENAPKEFLPAAEGEKIRNKPRRLFLKSLVFIFLFLVLLGGVGYSIFSKTKIEIWPRTEILNFKETITIDTAIIQSDFSKKTISAKIFKDQKIGSQDFPASGKIIKEQKAEGIIRVYSDYSSSPQGLWASTRFVSSDGKLFKSLKAETVPGKTSEGGKSVPGQQDIEIQAAESGEDYNIGPSTFSLPALAGTSKYTAFYGKSLSAMTGGFRGEVPQVVQKDIDQAKKTLEEKLEKESWEFLKTITPTDFIFLDSLVSQEVIQEKPSAENGKEANSFNLQTEIKSEVLSFKKSDIDSFAREVVSSKIPADKKIQEESLKINYNVISKEIGKAVISLDISAKVYSDVNPEELKKAFSGKSFQEINLLLKDLPQIKKIEIKTSPFWQKRVPEDFRRTEIGLNLND